MVTKYTKLDWLIDWSVYLSSYLLIYLFNTAYITFQVSKWTHHSLTVIVSLKKRERGKKKKTNNNNNNNNNTNKTIQWFIVCHTEVQHLNVDPQVLASSTTIMQFINHCQLIYCFKIFSVPIICLYLMCNAIVMQLADMNNRLTELL